MDTELEKKFNKLFSEEKNMDKENKKEEKKKRESEKTKKLNNIEKEIFEIEKNKEDLKYLEISLDIAEIVKENEEKYKEAYEKMNIIYIHENEFEKTYTNLLERILNKLLKEESVNLIIEIINKLKDNSLFLMRLFIISPIELKKQIEKIILEYIYKEKYEILMIYSFLSKYNKEKILNKYLTQDNVKFICDVWKNTDKEIQLKEFEKIVNKLIDRNTENEIPIFIKNTNREVIKEKLTLEIFIDIYKRTNSLIEVWGVLSENEQSKFLNKIIKILEEDNIENGEEIYYNTKGKNQKKLWDFFFIYKKRNKYEIFSLWNKTNKKIQEEKFEEIIKYYKDFEGKENNIIDIWKGTKKEIQKLKLDEIIKIFKYDFQVEAFWKNTDTKAQEELLKKVLKSNLEKEKKIAIWNGTKEEIQMENTFILKDIEYWSGTCKKIQKEKYKEITKNSKIDKKIDIWSNTKKEVQLEFKEDFIKIFKEITKDDEKLEKIWKKTNDEIKLMYWEEIIKIINEDKELILKIWSYSSNEFQQKIYRYILEIIIKENMIIDFWDNSSYIIQKEKFQEISNLLENNIESKLHFWKNTYEKIQQENIKFVEEFYNNLKDIRHLVDLWIYTSFKIQENNKKQPEILLEKISKDKKMSDNQKVILVNKIWNNTSPQIVNTYNNFYKSQKIIFLIEKKEKIKEKYQIYKEMVKINEDLNLSIDIRIFQEKILKIFKVEDLSRITIYPELQDKIIKYAKNENAMKIIGIAYKKTDSWVMELNEILENLDGYIEIIDELKDEDFQNNILIDNLISLISIKNNYFEINTISKLKNIETIKNNICNDVLEGKIKNKKYKELKKIAILELLYNIDYEYAENIVRKYGVDIKNIETINDKEEKIKEIILNLKEILNNEENNLYELYKTGKWKKEKIDLITFENKCINLFARIYNESFNISPIKIEEDKYKDKKVEVFKINDEFNFLVRVEGAYSYWEEPENFEENLNNIKINLNGNPKTYIAQNSMAVARPNGPIYGYNKDLSNNLLLMAPWDIISNNANLSFSPSSVKWNFENGIEFRTPEKLLNNMRFSHNEIVTLKWSYNEKIKKVQKDKPNFIVYFNDLIKDELDYREKDDWRISKKAATQLEIPIIIINREEILLKEKEKIIKSLKNFTKTLEENILEKIIIEFENNRSSMRYVKEELKEKYFTEKDRKKFFEIVEKEIIKIRKINYSKYKIIIKKLLEIIEEEINKYTTNTKIINKFAEEDINFYKRKYAYLVKLMNQNVDIYKE